VAGLRAARCFALAAEAHATGPLRLLRPRFPYDEEVHNLERAGRLAARAARRHASWHERSLDFIANLAGVRPAADGTPEPLCALHEPLRTARELAAA